MSAFVLICAGVVLLSLVAQCRAYYIRRRLDRAQAAYRQPEWRNNPDVRWHERFSARGPFWRGFLGLPVQR